jgi:aminoglycoside phosphotransferase (APT) family kinase protein
MTDSLYMLSQAASRLRLGIPCVLADECPCLGGSHRVFKIIFEDSVQWAARISNDPDDWKAELRVVRQFQHIKKQRPKIKAPDLFVEEEYPVVYSEWVSGKPLAIWNSRIPLLKRQRLLDDLAEFLLQLWTTPVPSTFAQEKSCLYSTWLTKSLDRGLRRTLRGTARWGNAINYLIMRSMIPDYAAEYDEYSGIGFAHGDLNAYNIMKSDDFHLTG